MSKLIDLSGITKLIGYETFHLLLRFVFNEIFIEAFHSEFEVIDFYSVKTDTSWIKTYPKLSLLHIIEKASTSRAIHLKLQRLWKRSFLVSIMVFITFVEFFYLQNLYRGRSKKLRITWIQFKLLFTPIFLHIILDYGFVIVTCMANTLYAYVYMLWCIEVWPTYFFVLVRACQIVIEWIQNSYWIGLLFSLETSYWPKSHI